MNSRETDRIWWVPDREGVNRPAMLGLVHRCPTAVVVAPTTRAALDWMALGTCRYCGEKLPEASA